MSEKLKLKMTVFSPEPSREQDWVAQIQGMLSPWVDLEVQAGSSASSLGQVVWVDGTDANSGFQGAQRILDDLLAAHDRRGRMIFLVVDEQLKEVPQPILEQKVDDLVLFPFRPLEVLSKIQHYEQFVLWSEVRQLNLSLSGLLSQLQFDLELAENLQKSKLPKRLGEVQGFDVKYRYLVGTRSGGDFFDLAESQDKEVLSVVLSHSSSYGLCNSLLAILMKVCVKLSADQLRQVGATTSVVRKIYDEIKLILGEKDFFSLFFGNVDRRTLQFSFTHLGDGAVFYGGSDPSQRREFQYWQPRAGVISKQSAISLLDEAHLQLWPKDRLVLVSGGALQSLGGIQRVLEVLNQGRKRQLADQLNDLVFQIKSSLDEGELPLQDCTLLALEVLPDSSIRVLEGV